MYGSNKKLGSCLDRPINWKKSLSVAQAVKSQLPLEIILRQLVFAEINVLVLPT
jgi:hypothetical protein